ncbi:MAG: hypothetical protein ABI386_07015, partial [Rhodanobacter sp.]
EVDSFSPAQGDGMDAGVEATQERLPDVLSKSPAPPHGLAGQDVRQAPSGVSFSLGYFSFGQAKEKYLGRRKRTKALHLNLILLPIHPRKKSRTRALTPTLSPAAPERAYESSATLS